MLPPRRSPTSPPTPPVPIGSVAVAWDGHPQHPLAVDVDAIAFVVLVEGAAVQLAEYLRRHPERRPGVLATLAEWLDAR
ncbi:hypothetical protein [Gemmata sp.]|uniref:hypothetical protein n=1 Tax=Gemmata sp. TaxID=1914242 RepID=UPI003F6E741E